MNFDGVTLQCFLAVCEFQNISKAALSINKSQSAVSQQILKLENLLEKKLFIREENLKLTKDGDIFYDYAKQIYSLQKEVFDIFKQPEMQGEVRFGLPEDFAATLLSDVLMNFRQIHPRIILNIECDLTMNLYEKFKHKKLDLVLLKMSKPRDFISGTEVLSEEMVWVGNKNILQIERNFAIPLILSPKPCVYRKEALKSLRKAGLKINIVFESLSYASKVSAVKAGLGIMVLPKNMIDKNLEIINSKILPKLNNMHLSLVKQNQSNQAVNSFEEFTLKKLQYL